MQHFLKREALWNKAASISLNDSFSKCVHLLTLYSSSFPNEERQQTSVAELEFKSGFPQSFSDIITRMPQWLFRRSGYPYSLSVESYKDIGGEGNRHYQWLKSYPSK